ncbi:MAG: response regulator transcription factor [Ornithinimicrobium sp.]
MANHDSAAGIVRIVVADDQPLMRQAVSSFFDAEPGHTVIGTAQNGREAVRVVAELRPDLVLMDLDMPEMNGVEATAAIVAAGGRTKVVVLTTFSIMDWIAPALRAGASGYLVKDAAPDELVNAVQRVMADETVLAPAVTQLLVAEVADSAAAERASVSVRPPLGDLTERESQVVNLLAGGLSNKEIAEEMHLSLGSVKLHIGKASDRLGARDRVQLLVRAIELDLVRPTLLRPETAWDRYR